MTTTTAPAALFNRDAFHQLLAESPLPDWADQQRRSCMDQLEELVLPDRRQEHWMRTDLRMFKPDMWGLRPWGGVSQDVFAAVLWHPGSKKTNKEDWSQAVRDGKVTVALRVLNPKKKRGPWAILCDNEGGPKGQGQHGGRREAISAAPGLRQA